MVCPRSPFAWGSYARSPVAQLEFEHSPRSLGALTRSTTSHFSFLELGGPYPEIDTLEGEFLLVL